MADDRSQRAIEAEAAAWLARLNGPHRSEASEEAFRAWLRRDPAHEAAFERAAEIWELIPGAGVAAEPVADRSETPSRRAVLAMAAGVLALLSAGGGYFLLARPPVHETRVGEQQTVMLDDGTRISLNTDSRIAIFYSDTDRRVRLDQGEAMFEVAHNPARPFIVVAGDEQVRALGTAFVVRRDAGRTAITLIEGRVEVTGAIRARRTRIAMLSPGQRVTVTPNSGAALDRPAVEAVTAWRRGEVVFEDMSLLEAAEELNRYSGDHLVVADPSLASLRISGVFSTGDLGEVAQAIAQLHDLQVRRDGSEFRLTRR